MKIKGKEKRGKERQGKSKIYPEGDDGKEIKENEEEKRGVETRRDRWRKGNE